MPRRTSRPTVLTDEIAERIYDCIWRNVSAMTFCADPRMPTYGVYYRWRRQDAYFDQRVRGLMAHRAVRHYRPHRGVISYRPELADEVIARLRAGEPLAVIARDPKMPSVNTIRKWARVFTAFGEAFRLAMEVPKRKTPRRRLRWSEAVAEEICDRVMRGESLRSVCADPRLPAERTVYGWVQADPAFARRYRLACEIQGQLLADMALELAERATPGTAGALKGPVGALMRRARGPAHFEAVDQERRRRAEAAQARAAARRRAQLDWWDQGRCDDDLSMPRDWML